MTAGRMVVKVGSSSLTDGTGCLDNTRLHRLVDMVCRVRADCRQQVVLVSSGAVAAGLSRLGWRRETLTIPEKQAAAAVGQGLLIDLYERAFAERGVTVAQLLLTRDDVADRRRFVNVRNTLETLLHHGVLPIVNENDTVAVDEIRFGDNDTLSALTALVVKAQQLVLLTDIDGLYTANPRQDSGAVRIQEVYEITPEIEALAGGEGSRVGTGGMRTKLAAAKIATSAGIQVIIASSAEPDVLLRIARGEPLGTRFHAREQPLAGKRSWVAFSARCEGVLWVDGGAAEALAHGGGSLLLPGITRVEGHFEEGAVVEVRDPEGRPLARGLVNFSSSDLELWLAQRPRGGAKHLPEVIHRNDMVVWEGVQS
jgi:glutamate 5-kinase